MDSNLLRIGEYQQRGNSLERSPFWGVPPKTGEQRITRRKCVRHVINSRARPRHCYSVRVGPASTTRRNVGAPQVDVRAKPRKESGTRMTLRRSAPGETQKDTSPICREYCVPPAHADGAAPPRRAAEPPPPASLGRTSTEPLEVGARTAAPSGTVERVEVGGRVQGNTA